MANTLLKQFGESPAFMIAGIDYCQILRAVVSSYAVQVMNNFIFTQQSPVVLFPNKPVFQDITATILCAGFIRNGALVSFGRGDDDVPLTMNVTTPSPKMASRAQSPFVMFRQAQN